MKLAATIAAITCLALPSAALARAEKPVPETPFLSGIVSLSVLVEAPDSETVGDEKWCKFKGHGRWVCPVKVHYRTDVALPYKTCHVRLQVDRHLRYRWKYPEKDFGCPETWIPVPW